MTPRDTIVAQALALSVEDRIYLIDELERSFDDGESQSPEIAAAWGVEIERRIAAYERGEMKAEDAYVVLDRIEKELNEKRLQREAGA